MKKRWILVIDEYKGIRKKAVNLLAGYLSGVMDFVLEVKTIDKLTDEEQNTCNILAVGKLETNSILSACEKAKLITLPNQAESYSICVCKSPKNNDLQIIAIAGYDENGVLYGCVDFINLYCGCELHKNGDIWNKNYFNNLFDENLPEWKQTKSPAIKTRALWTWGCVIYDYKAYLENMAKLKLNEIVIWNDFAPLNAKDVVEYAHSLGIRVIWGFAWGWDTECVKSFEKLGSKEGLLKIKNNAVSIYETQYLNTGCDGIYFQSFTEMSEDTVDGVSVAETVTRLVNDTAGELLNKYPNLHIQFGLHATSVKSRLEIIKNIDKRIYIVWEDCGAFPYDYYPDKVVGYNETYNLTKNLLTLRGEEEKFGAVFKGMLKLDWQSFEHHTGSFILGERDRTYILERQAKKDKIWKIINSSWLLNAEYLRKTVELINKNGKFPIVQALVEDGVFENEITLPVSIYAETLWTPNLKIEEIISNASKSPFVRGV